MKELEERGIGRPSTYATILSTIQERQYVTKTPGRGGKFIPTEIGLVVTDLLVDNFKDIFDPQYTARLEEELDEIEEGKEKWTDALGEFYRKFEKDLSYAEKHMENIKRMEKPTDQKCERCGAPLVIKWGKHGSFFACCTYDKNDPNSCTFTKENPIDLTDLDRPRCRKRSRRKSTARTAAGRWCSSADASGSSWPAPAIPTARPPAAWIRARKSRTFRWTRNVRSAGATWCCATAATANSSPAPAIRTASA